MHLPSLAITENMLVVKACASQPYVPSCDPCPARSASDFWFLCLHNAPTTPPSLLQNTIVLRLIWLSYNRFASPHPFENGRAALDEIVKRLISPAVPIPYPGYLTLTTVGMPYTPPSHMSPAASQPTSPASSHSQSYLSRQQPPNPDTTTSSRPQLPRSSGSSSYINKPRRSTSSSSLENTYGLTNGSAYSQNRNFDPHGSLRQSPPPVNNSLIPAGMTISPPESSHNSSDDEDVRGRTRDSHDIFDLRAAVSVLHQRPSGSPDRNRQEDEVITKTALELLSHQGDGPSAPQSSSPTRPPVSQSARKISRPRSITDSNVAFVDESAIVQSPVRFSAPSDEDDESVDSDEAMPRRPAMLRKKSGELVKPAIRASSRRRPSSMPGTPTYSKAVHFDSHLEHVRHFLQVDRPLAVSAGSSPVDAHESEGEFPFGSDESSQRPRGATYEWEIKLANFPSEMQDRSYMPVRVERVFLSPDNKNLVVNVAVQNLAFQKFVVARFTLDYWKTTSEIVAEFDNDVRKKRDDGCDRFSFTIKLADQANLESKTLFFCVRYNVNGQEHWDSNNGFNYQVDFTKNMKSQPSKPKAPVQSGLGVRPITALPHSRRSPSASAGAGPKMKASFDDFSTGFDSFNTFQSAVPSLEDGPPLRLRTPRSRSEFPDAPVRRPKTSAPAFAARYDFKTSLNAAKRNAWDELGEESGLSLRPDAKQSSHEVPAFTASKSTSPAPPKLENGLTITTQQQTIAPGSASSIAKPAALVQEKPSLTSQSYQELVDKYCFVGTRPKGEDPKKQ